jgi:hypothetical protein
MVKLIQISDEQLDEIERKLRLQLEGRVSRKDIEKVIAELRAGLSRAGLI